MGKNHQSEAVFISWKADFIKSNANFSVCYNLSILSCVKELKTTKI
jgi:hypothetical protein